MHPVRRRAGGVLHDAAPPRPDPKPRLLRTPGLVIGSAPVTKELADQIEDAFGVTVGESYGLTEGGPVMLGPPLDGRPVPHGSCGVAWPEGEVKLVGETARPMTAMANCGCAIQA